MAAGLPDRTVDIGSVRTGLLRDEGTQSVRVMDACAVI